MKAEQISQALGEISQELVQEALPSKKKRFPWKRWVAAAACLSLVLGIGAMLLEKKPDKKSTLSGPHTIPDSDGSKVFLSPELPSSVKLLAQAGYPKMPPFPARDYDMEKLDRWQEFKDQIAEQKENFVIPEGFSDFCAVTAKEFMNADEESNAAYSPLSLYMALSMLAELTDGNSRAQILELLQVETIEELRKNAASLWLFNYSDDGVLTTILANSLWLRDDLHYEEGTMERLAEIYYASAFAGTMGSEEFNSALRNWVDLQTGGLLKEQAQGLTMEQDTVLALASTIYFKGSWIDKFPVQNTKVDTFYGTEAEISAEFMHRDTLDYYYRGENYTACQSSMANGASMWLILPEEGVDPKSLLSEDKIYQMTLAGAKWGNAKYVDLSLTVPKFDISAKMDLSDSLQSLGLRDVFDPDRSDFTPMTKEVDKIFVSQAEQAVRVKIDEEGCEAAAYTFMATEATGAIVGLEHIDLTFDRPFLFVITGGTNQPLFMGTVYDPTST